MVFDAVAPLHAGHFVKVFKKISCLVIPYVNRWNVLSPFRRSDLNAATQALSKNRSCTHESQDQPADPLCCCLSLYATIIKADFNTPLPTRTQTPMPYEVR